MVGNKREVKKLSKKCKNVGIDGSKAKCKSNKKVSIWEKYFGILIIDYWFGLDLGLIG